MKKLTIRIVSIVAGIVTIVTWLRPDDLYIRDRVIITLMVAVVYLIYICIELRKRYKELALKHSDISQKHKALASQLDSKLLIIKEYEDAKSSIMQLLAVAMLNKKGLRFDALAEAIVFHFKQIDKD